MTRGRNFPDPNRLLPHRERLERADQFLLGSPDPLDDPSWARR
jgi:hypothetical protein